MRNRFLSTMLGAAASVAVAGAAHAIGVPGTADPYLVNQGGGGVFVRFALLPGGALTFSATGATNYNGDPPTGTPDGDPTYIFDMTADYGTGISGPLQVPVNALVGVFVGPGVPGGTAPAQLDYTSGLDFTTATPGLDQIFFIGDGLTGTGSGTSQTFDVPTGASRLYLGTADGSGWYNNTGAYAVTVSGNGLGAPIAGVPEPGAWAMMLLGFGGVGVMTRRRRLRPLTSV